MQPSGKIDQYCPFRVCDDVGTVHLHDIHTSKEYVNKVIKKQEGIVNRTYVQILEALGYDIELVYVKRTED